MNLSCIIVKIQSYIEHNNAGIRKLPGTKVKNSTLNFSSPILKKLKLENNLSSYLYSLFSVSQFAISYICTPSYCVKSCLVLAMTILG